MIQIDKCIYDMYMYTPAPSNGIHFQVQNVGFQGFSLVFYALPSWN